MLLPYSLGALVIFLLLVKALKLSEKDRYFLSHVLPKTLQRLIRFI